MPRIPLSAFGRASAAIALALSLAFAPATAQDASSQAAPTASPFVKGISWGWVGYRGEYQLPAAADSMQKLADTGAEWVCIAFGALMDTPESTHIRWRESDPRIVDDDDVRAAIKLARDNDLKVILKPVVNCSDNTWRAWIKFFRPVTAEERARGVTGEQDPWGPEPVFREGQVADQAKWAEWWANYQEYMVHFAELAEAENCEMFCLGCEMNSTEANVEQWRYLIAKVRLKYHGQLTYDVNHHRERDVAWWDAVDVIGVSAYYHVPPPQGQTEEEAVRHTTDTAEIAAELRKMRDELAKIHEQFGKPILFIETGVTNVRGCARAPWSHPDAELGRPLDDQEQANYYQAMFDVFWDQPWFAGFCWWDWPAQLYPSEAADENRGFCPYGKAAENLVREWYAKPR